MVKAQQQAILQQQQEMAMRDQEVIEGHLIVYYQHDHGVENKLMDIRQGHLCPVLVYLVF